MASIYVVYGEVLYEGRDNIRAFSDKAAAEKLAGDCSAHDQKKPEYPAEYEEKCYAKYERAEKRWRRTHPGGESACHHDFFGVEELQLD